MTEIAAAEEHPPTTPTTKTTRPGEELWKTWEQKIATSFPRARAMPTARLAELLNNHQNKTAVVLLDVRGAPEFGVSRLHSSAVRFDDGSGGADLSEIAQMVEAAKGGEELHMVVVVCYCSIGYRSSRLAQRLVDAGGLFSADNVYNLEGGLFQWTNEGRPVVRVDEHTYEVVQAEGAHPYNSTFGQMLEAKYHRFPVEEDESWGCSVS